MKSGVAVHTYSPQLVPRLQDCCEFNTHGEILSQNKPANNAQGYLAMVLTSNSWGPRFDTQRRREDIQNEAAILVDTSNLSTGAEEGELGVQG